MMNSSGLPRIYADFNNCDAMGRVRLNTLGSKQDLNRIASDLVDGMQAILCDDGLEVRGVISVSRAEGFWIGLFDPVNLSERR